MCLFVIGGRRATICSKAAGAALARAMQAVAGRLRPEILTFGDVVHSPICRLNRCSYFSTFSWLYEPWQPCCLPVVSYRRLRASGSGGVANWVPKMSKLPAFWCGEMVSVLVPLRSQAWFWRIGRGRNCQWRQCAGAVFWIILDPSNLFNWIQLFRSHLSRTLWGWQWQ